MTTKQIIKKLESEKISTTHLTITKDEVEVFVPSTSGKWADSEKSKALARKVCKALGFGGHSCAHGGWVLQPKPITLGDWNNKNSQWHH